MNRILLYLLFLSSVSLAIFGYLYYRDVIKPASADETDRCAPFGLVAEAKSSTSIEVSWETVDDCAGYLIYGLSSEDTDKLALSENGEILSRSHSVSLRELIPNTTYYIYIFSEGEVYGANGLPIVVQTKEL